MRPELTHTSSMLRMRARSELAEGNERCAASHQREALHWEERGKGDREPRLRWHDEAETRSESFAACGNLLGVGTE